MDCIAFISNKFPQINIKGYDTHNNYISKIKKK